MQYALFYDMERYEDCVKSLAPRCHDSPKCLRRMAALKISLTEAVNSAAMCGDVEFLTYALDNGGELTQKAAENAILGASKYSVSDLHYACLVLLCERNAPLSDRITYVAAERQNLKSLKLVRKDGAMWHPDTLSVAVYDIDCLKYAIDNDAPWCPKLKSLVANAFKGLATLTYLYELGCRHALWEPDFTRGVYSVECLKYAMEHGAVWDPDTTIIAAGCGFTNAFVYAVQHGAPLHPDLTKISVVNFDVSVLKILHEHGAVWHPGTTWAAYTNHDADCLEYALSHGAPKDMRI